MMDLKVSISASDGTEKFKIFDQLHEAQTWIALETSQWNSFESGNNLYIMIQKVESLTDTTTIQTAEKIDMKTVVGRP